MKREYGIKGEFFYEIVDEKSGIVLTKSKKKSNIILYQGLDYLALRSFVENFSNCAVSSSAIGPLYTDTGLINEFARTNTLDTSLQTSASTTTNGNIISFLRVFKFPSSINPSYYGSVGWSYTSTPGNNLFSKSLILTVGGGPGPVFVAQGQYLRIYYTLIVTINPTNSTSGNSNMTNLPAADGGNFALQLYGLRSINGQNVLGYIDAASDANELYSVTEVFLSTVSTALGTFGSPVNRSATSYTTRASNTYMGPGTGIVKKVAGFGKNNAVNTINSMGTGPVGSSATNSGFVYVFTNGQAKSAGFNFSPIFIYSIVSHS